VIFLNSKDNSNNPIKRVNVNVPLKTKEKWDNFVKNSEFSTLSNLIRESVDFFINSKEKQDNIRRFSEYSHELKEELNAIKGFSQILIEEYKDELSWEILLKIKEIYDKSVNIEKIINKILGKKIIEKKKYDILIIEDDESTILLLTEYFKKKGLSTLTTSSAEETFEVLRYSKPKLILLDILLPGESGYEICKKIKLEKDLKEIPVYFITAVPESEVYSKIKETKADGYFLKPFNMLEFNNLIKELKIGAD